MLRFLRYVLATFVALVLFAVLSIVVLVVIAAGANPPEQIKEGSVFHLKIDKPLAEREYKSMWSGVRGAITGSDESRIGLLELRMAIKEAAANDNIKGIYLDAGSVKSGIAMLDELRNELIAFKKSGKFIISYSESYTEGGYYLASVADEIVLMPAGMLEFNGLRAEIMFFKGTLEKLELQPEIFRVGNYKSAVEPFFREDMSKENREQINGYLSAINNHIIKGVAQARGLDTAQVHLISDSMLVHNGKDAVKYNFITKLGYYDEAEELIRKSLKLEKDGEIHFTGYKTLHNLSQAKIDKAISEDDEVAVIFATGEIIDGRGGREVIGSLSMSEQIRKAREDEDVKAVVIRINSPGGSAAGSDAIWREIILTSRVKPVIASMSDVCASGGYYMAMACDTIVASPVTITGSIGVWGLMFNGKDFLKNKLGITVDRERTGKFSDVPSFTRPLTDYEKQMIQQEVNSIYADFVNKAAEGRHTDSASIDRVAGGRVWAGAQAKEINLIDTYGGLQTAIDLAAKRAGLKEFSITYLPKAKVSLLKEILSGVDDEDEDASADAPVDAAVLTELGPWYEYFKTLQELQKLNGVQARMPYGVTIE